MVDFYDYVGEYYDEDGVFALAWDFLPTDQIVKLIYQAYCTLGTVLELSGEPAAEDTVTAGRQTELYEVGAEKLARGELTESNVYRITKDYLNKPQVMKLARNKLESNERFALIHTIVDYLTGR